MVLPIGSRFGKNRRANVWLTIATASEVLVSLLVKFRPASNGVRSVARYPGETALSQVSVSTPVTGLGESVVMVWDHAPPCKGVIRDRLTETTPGRERSRSSIASKLATC